jgi:cytosine/adenosine deaminase-related metal-dependent hydrolase
MSGSMSATVRFEDHFGPIVPVVTEAPEGSASSATPTGAHAESMRALVEQMRASVAAATKACDVAARVELWEAYRRARAEAMALASTSDASSPRRLHSL